MASERLDLFPGPVPEELRIAHELLDEIFSEFQGKETHSLKPKDISETISFRRFEGLAPDEQVKLFMAAVERAHWQEREINRPGSKAYHTSLTYLSENTPQHFGYLLETFLRVLAGRKLATKDRDTVATLSVIRRAIPNPHANGYNHAGVPWGTAQSILRVFQNHVKRNGLNIEVATEALAVAKFLRDSQTDSQARAATQRKLAEQLEFLARPIKNLEERLTAIPSSLGAETGAAQRSETKSILTRLSVDAVAAIRSLLDTANLETTNKRLREYSEIRKLESTKRLLSASPEEKVAVVVITAQSLGEAAQAVRSRSEKNSDGFWNLWAEATYPRAGVRIVQKVLERPLPFAVNDFHTVLGALALLSVVTVRAIPFLGNLVRQMESASGELEFVSESTTEISQLINALSRVGNAEEARIRRRLEELLKLAATKESPSRSSHLMLKIYPGENWSDAAIRDFLTLSPERQEGWAKLIAHCRSATSASLTTGWLKLAKNLIKAVKWSNFEDRIPKWFELVDKPRTQAISDWNREYQPDPNELIVDPHMDVLRGLAWCCSLREDKALARALAGLARSAYRKIPKLGPRAVRVGNACVTALGRMPGMEGVYQLALLKVKVKFRTAQKLIEKAFDVAATRAGLPRNEIEELAVPSYGLTEVGLYKEEFGEYRAILKVTGTVSTELTFVNQGRKEQRGVPSAVKADYKEELAELKLAAKDIQRVLPAQRDRIDSLFLEQKKWAHEIWRERYLDHPLVGVLARRLLWTFTSGKNSTTGIWFGGRIVDLDLKEVACGSATEVELWHPIGKDVDEVLAWRSWLDAQGVQQPFKQAHREIYLLTDAERRTNTYSNRYAAHVLKQHQFSALCAVRGWKNKLRLMVDADFPPATRHLEKWGLRAEFWVDGIGDDYGTHTNEAGVFLYLSTDQVRFYRIGTTQRTAQAGGGGYHPVPLAEDPNALRLEEIPPLVFSEIMRDVDLFVGVTSVGNDPTWWDGGPNGRYADYWNNFSFGELTESAKTRKAVLERLVPRLKIAGQCTFTERYLVVKGKIRTYKIHLGSGNILMLPNDQYLCIVPRQGTADEGKVLLPFEGDRTLSTIISKAILLSADEKITDETILRQIEGR